MKISTDKLYHEYPSLRGDPLLALKNIQLDINEGEFVALIGPSGCGKSTLLRILAGLLKPTNGKVCLDGNQPSDVLITKRIGWLGQNPSLLPWRTVQANVSLAQEINPQKDRIVLPPAELLKLVRLEDFGNAYPFTLSGGMQQRVALARTLALGASIWLMDEPFAALDELTRETLTNELLDLWEQFGPTVLWVTHHIYEAIRLADRVLVMSPQPGHISHELAIILPRPRNDASLEFQEILISLRESLGAFPINTDSNNTHQL